MAKTRKNDSLENQKIRDIPLDSLILWTENPRDPMPGAQTNEEIIRHALDNESTWRLRRLSKEMGEEFDKSELPTVVKKPGTAHYIVFDGNRRVILAMLRRDGFPLEATNSPCRPSRTTCHATSATRKPRSGTSSASIRTPEAGHSWNATSSCTSTWDGRRPS